jgi:cytoskeleton protein RodZ
MTQEIGATLREARNRRRVDLTEVEAHTKIRVRYLRALENEEWDVLPGDAYARGFIRTYAGYLGLDGERLAEDYRRLHEGVPAERLPRPEPRPRRERSGPLLSPGVLAALVTAGLIGVLVVIGLASGGDEGPEAARPQAQKPGAGAQKPPEPAADRFVELSLTAEADVWTCLIDDSGEELIDGLILTAGQEEGPFRSRGFLVSFGNGAVEMTLDGEPAALEDTPNPVGYRVGRGASVTPLSEAERPDCT